ncbi:MAG: ABC transporter ATP-binding protein [Ilumatobacteraceae bacterium]
MATIELRAVTMVHATAAGPLVAVAPTSLTIAEGEFFVLIGPSGCGKTTLLRLIAGIERPTTGEVVLDGVVVNELDARGRDVAMIFQSSALYPNLTVADNIGFSLRLAKVRRREIDRRVRHVAAMVSVEHLLGRRPMSLSGGERQRVAMARTLIRSPHLFLMDEPMSQLDAKLRTELRAELARLQREVAVTTVYVTHDQAEAMSMGHRVAVMRRGSIVQCDTPEVLYRHPIDLFVAQFLGTPPMNAWRASVVGGRHGDVVLRWGSHAVPLTARDVERFGGAADLVGHDVVVGLRADGFVVDAVGPLTISPSFGERLGPFQLIHGTMPGESARAGDDGLVRTAGPVAPIVAAVSMTLTPDPWQPLHLGVDLDQLMLFDPLDGRSLEAAATTRPLVTTPG